MNTASKCGFTPQFEALEALNAKYGGRGFTVLGFPSGDFREQEFEDEQQIQAFCTLTYGVKFPMFERVHVTGDAATPLYRDLARAAGQAPQWNFHKYLVGRDGRVVANWGSRTRPDDPEVVAAIERALAAPRPNRRVAERRLRADCRDRRAPRQWPAGTRRPGAFRSGSTMTSFLRGVAALFAGCDRLCRSRRMGAGQGVLETERDRVSYMVGIDVARSLNAVGPDMDLAAFERAPSEMHSPMAGVAGRGRPPRRSSRR